MIFPNICVSVIDGGKWVNGRDGGTARWWKIADGNVLFVTETISLLFKMHACVRGHALLNAHYLATCDHCCLYE